MPITCKSCGQEGDYKVDLLLVYEAKCEKCGSNFDHASDTMNGLIDKSNETYELLQVIIGIEEHFGKEYKGRQVEDIKSIQDLITVTEVEFANQGYDSEKINKDLIAYLHDKYRVDK